jgi:hypothetical protein
MAIPQKLISGHFLVEGGHSPKFRFSLIWLRLMHYKMGLGLGIKTKNYVDISSQCGDIRLVLDWRVFY